MSLFALGLMLYGEPVRINTDILANIGLKNFVFRNKTYTAEATSTILISTMLGLVTEAILIAFLRS